MEKEKEYMQRSMNWKKIWLLCRKRIWLAFVSMAITAVIGAGIYKLVCVLNDEGQFYRVSSDYYLTFNLTDHPDGVDYYNAYTWDSILRDDPVVDSALAVLSKDYTKEEIKASVSGEMLGDYRILTVHATHADPARAEEIAEAYAKSLNLFGEKMELFNSIERWSKDDCIPVIEKDLTVNAAAVGAVIGLLLFFILWSLYYVLDDSIYVEGDFTQRFTIPFLGTLTKKNSELCKQELSENLTYLLKEKDNYHMVFATEKQSECVYPKAIFEGVKASCPKIESVLFMHGTDMDILRKSNGVVLMIPWGSKNGNIVEKTIAFLEKQDCKMAGVILYDGDDAFIKSYYGSR